MKSFAIRRPLAGMWASLVASVALCIGLLLVGMSPAKAWASATLCVNPSGSNGCYANVQNAIDAVSAVGTTISIAPGRYTATCSGPACSVASISVSAANGSSLAGLAIRCRKDDGRSAVLNATGLDHAVYVGGVSGVTVKGCVAKNADREGILVENSADDHIANNEVLNNDQSMGLTVGTGSPPCPTFISPGTPGTSAILCCPDAYSGGPGNFPEDNDDCGEGIHLRGVTQSVVEGNSVHDNIGGILLSDETGPNSNNLIVDNSSSHNLKFGGDCGVTLASHVMCGPGSSDAAGCLRAEPVEGVLQANGVFHNAVVNNVLEQDGASGAGIFTNPGGPPGAATKAYGNLISENVVEDNGQPGISIHVHAANGNADNNVITENTVSGNGGDSEAEGPTPPHTGIEVLSNAAFGVPFGAAAPIAGTVVSQNKVLDEDIDLWMGNTDTTVNVFLNDLLGNGAVGLENGGSGTAVATDDYWGCPKGPGATGCSSISNTAGGTVVSSPFLSQPVNPEQ